MFSLQGKHALVTGGASGLGLAIAKRFTAAGAVVTVCDLADPAGVCAEIGASFVRADVSDAAQVDAAFTKAADQRGSVDVLVNNAGINGKDGVDIEASDLALTQKLFAVNALGVYHGLKYGPGAMNDGGSVVNTASLGATLVFPGSGPYSASKASVLSLTQMAAAELAPRGIRVNAVAPSFVRTPMAQEDGALFEKIGRYATAAGRVAEPEEVASVYHFLASEDASYVNGQIINVDGGMSIGFTAAGLELIASASENS